MLAKYSFLLFAVTAFLALIPASEGKEVARDVLIRALRSADPGPRGVPYKSGSRARGDGTSRTHISEDPGPKEDPCK